MRWGNCWLFALPRWLRNPRSSYLVVRISKHGIWPHVFFASDIDGLPVEEFVPRRPRRGLLGFFHAIFFNGRVRRGIGEQFKD